MTAIDTFAERNNLRVVEDLAEAHGVRPHINTDAACWSFYKNKIIAGEEGGMVAFRDARHATIARSLRSLGFTERHDFQHIPRGHNYRLSNCHAELIRVSLKSVEWNQRRRREIEEQYNDYMPHPLVWRMPLKRDVVWVYDLRIPGMTSGQQDQLIKALNERGIAARHAFKPMSQQWEYRQIPQDTTASLMSREVIYLPVDPRRDCIHEIFRGGEFAEMIRDSSVNAHPVPA
jgi:dTDP-4-amino-4,6-dideoxygalactose transaminase